MTNLNSFENIPFGKTHLEQIIKKATLIIKLDRAIKSMVPPILKINLRVANYRQHILIIEVSSAAWLTRIRYEQTQLLSILRAQLLPELISISFKVNPNVYLNPPQNSNELILQPPTQTIKPIKNCTAELLGTLADKSSSELATKLKRLAKLVTTTPNTTS